MMPIFDAVMRVTHVETWSVEAEDEHEARKKLNGHDGVETDETGGEVVDWKISRIKERDVAG